MKTIARYPFHLEDNFTLMLPVWAKILTVQMVRDEPSLFALVDEQPQTQESRRFFLFGANACIDPALIDPLTYVGTFQNWDQNMVFHLFMVER